MQGDYYQNTVYPFQDKLLKIMTGLPVDFYLTGGTVLSRVYLKHRYSDDLDFFVNNRPDFKSQVEAVIRAFDRAGLSFDPAVAGNDYARLFVMEDELSLKLDFVNDVSYRYGTPCNTPLFVRTDDPLNILSNKISALSRLAAKDVADVVYLSGAFAFNWGTILNDASEKDLWVNPVDVAEVLEQFPPEKLNEINWIGEIGNSDWFSLRINHIIKGILTGSDNTPDIKNSNA